MLPLVNTWAVTHYFKQFLTIIVCVDTLMSKLMNSTHDSSHLAAGFPEDGSEMAQEVASSLGRGLALPQPERGLWTYSHLYIHSVDPTSAYL